MRVRTHHGSLDKAMETMQEIPATKEGLREWAAAALKVFPLTPDELDTLKVAPYSSGPDTRIGWHETNLITYRFVGVGEACVLGYCDELLSL